MKTAFFHVYHSPCYKQHLYVGKNKGLVCICKAVTAYFLCALLNKLLKCCTLVMIATCAWKHSQILFFIIIIIVIIIKIMLNVQSIQ